MPTPSFQTPNARGLRRFTAPRGQEVLSVSAAPDGSRLVAASGTAAYVFDKNLSRATVVDLPGVHQAPIAVTLSSRRAAVLVRAPTATPEGRLYLLDVEAGRRIAEVSLGGAPVAGAAVVGGRLAVVLEDPPGVVVFDGERGERLGEQGLPGIPTRIAPSVDRTWATIAAGAGVAVLDVAGDAPRVTTPSIGPGRVVPVVAVPVGGDAVLLVGKENGRPIARVVPRGGGDVRRLEVGGTEALGAAVDAAGERALVFTVEPSVRSFRRTYVFDSRSWAPVGTIDEGPALPGSPALMVGGRVLVLRCHTVVALDLSARTATVSQEVPSPREGPPCLSDLSRAGDHAVARDGTQLVAWPLL